MTAAERNVQLDQLLGETTTIALELSQSRTVGGITEGGGSGYSDLTHAIMLARFTRWSLQNPTLFYALFATVLICALWGLGAMLQAIGEV